MSTAPKSKLLNSIYYFLFLIVGILSASFITTKTFDFNGLSTKAMISYKKHFKHGLKEFTADELAQYDGSDLSKPIYLAINGKVFDVSAGPKYYGKGGSYGYFSGKDASRAYITG